MPLYTYEAKDSSGGKRTGTVDAKSESLAVSLLKDRSLYVISLKKKESDLIESVLNFTGIPENEVVTFTRQFSTMISAGLTISRALDVLSQQTENTKFKKVLLEVLRDIEGGSTLSQSLSRHPKVFSTTYVALVSAGEASGKLDQILQRLADTMEAERELSSKLKSAMVYPAIVICAMVGVFILLMVFVIPKLSEMYDSLNVELPKSTQVMIKISHLFTEKYALLLMIVAGLFFFFRWFFGTEEGQNAKNYLAFNLPVFGKLNRQKELTSFTRTLSLLIASAIPIVEALNIVADVVSNRDFKAVAKGAAENVEKGNSLSEYFKYSDTLPPLVGQMASVGEETGQMDDVLLKVSDFFDSETNNLIKGLSSALEPVILVALGGMIAVLIISIITPIYKITSAI